MRSHWSTYAQVPLVEEVHYPDSAVPVYRRLSLVHHADGAQD